jgi:prepilin-type processing-associated H-X9-DG protein
VTNLPDLRPNPDFQARLGTTMLWLYTLDSSLIPNDANKPAPNFYIADNVAVYGEAKINGLDADIIADRPSICRPSSNHHGVSVVAFADGHVTALSEQIEYHVYTQLMTPNGRRSDAPYATYLLNIKDYEP